VQRSRLKDQGQGALNLETREEIMDVKRSRRPIALAVVGALFWMLSVAHPWVYLRAREVVLREQPGSNVTPRIYTLLSQAEALRDQLQGSETIGYVSEGEFDLRVGGPLQGRYYLAQYALAPTLLDLDAVDDPTPGPSGHSVSHELVLACFRHPRQLKTYLADESRQSLLTLSPNVSLTRSRGH
jgi:hypothetical protein